MHLPAVEPRVARVAAALLRDLPSSIALGRTLYASGAVGALSHTDVAVTARVRSQTGRGTYRVSGLLRPSGITCSCSWGGRCKHVAAVLIALSSESPATSSEAPRAPIEAQAPAHVRAWLERLEGPRSFSDQERLAFRLELEGSAPSVSLAVQWRATKRHWGAPRGLTREQIEQVVEGRLGEAALVEAVQAVSWDGRGSVVLRGKAGAAVLAALLPTGRLLRWYAERLVYFAAGPAIRGTLEWRRETAAASPRVEVGGESVSVMPLSPLHYVDLSKGLVGVVEVDAAPALAQAWVAAPRIPDAAGPEVTKRLGAAAPEAPAPPVRVFERIETAPTPILRLLEVDAPYWRGGGREVVAELSFRYGSVRISGATGENPYVLHDPDKTVEVARSRDAEGSARGVLLGLGFMEHAGSVGTEVERWTLRSQAEWLFVLMEDSRRLRERGFEIEVDPSFSLCLLDTSDWFTELEPSDNEWFEIQVGALVGGERVALLPLLVEALGRDTAPPEGFFLELTKGRFIHVPYERVAPLAALLIELYGDRPKNGKFKLSRWHSIDIAEQLRQEGETFEALRRLRLELTDTTKLRPVKLPKSFRGKLRDYQAQGVAWLARLARAGLGGLLADDMGLGKTVQIIALLCARRAEAEGPSLIVAPTSVLLSWAEQLQTFAPSLDVVIWNGSGRFRERSRMRTAAVVVTSYALLRRDVEELEPIDWDLLVLDEAQAIKNTKTAFAEAAKRLKARQRIALTGTPIENHLGELWSIVSFTNPGALGSAETFRRVFRTPIEKQGHAERLVDLRRRLAPLLLRRTKEEVASELPAKTIVEHPIDLEDAQRDVYETIRLLVAAKVRDEIARKGAARAQIMMLDALLKLRQVCCDPRLVKAKTTKKGVPSAKLEAFEDLVATLVDEGRRVLVFSQFVEMLEILRSSLDKLDIGHAMLTGSTVDRAAAVDRFRRGGAPVFLISLKAGGTGLNLVEADTVIHYDPWWNPAVEAQATDRAHRIGQTKPVFVHRLVARGTVEEKIVALQKKKAELANGLLEGSSRVELDARMIEELLAPLPERAGRRA